MVFANALFKASYLYDKSLCYLCSRHIDMNVHIVHEFIYTSLDQGLYLIGIRFTYTIMMWVATQSKFACLHLLANLKFLLMNTIIILSKYQFLCILYT